MRLQDFADPFEDLSVHIEDEELLEQAAALEPTLLHPGSRIGGALWMSLVAAAAGAFAGATFSDEVRSSWTNFIAYLSIGAVVLRALHPLGKRLVGESIAWQAVLAFFWSFLLATVAVLGARVETRWLSNTVSIGGGLFVGLMNGSFGPGFMKREEVWMLTSLPLAAFAAWSATDLQRALQASTNPAWSEAYAGMMAACVLMVPLAVLMAMLSSRSAGLAKMATLYLHNQNFTAKAIEYLDQAIALSPRSADLYNLRGIAYSKFGDGARADADFKMVTELSPRAAEAHMNRGVDFMRQGDYDRAIDALTLATNVNPKLATAFSNMGTAYQKKGDLDAAIENYNRAITLRPKYPIAFSNRAYSHHLKGDHDRAIADATHAIALDGRLPMAHLNLGHALAGKGEMERAARSFRRALALSPEREVEEETLQAMETLGIALEGDDEEDDD